MAGILDGIRVIEFAALGGGPLAGLILGDFGAEIIKIENPVGGDPSRIMFQPRERKIPPEDHSILYEFSNRNKRGITLNLSLEKGREIAHGLIEKSDVFISNYFPRTLKKMGFDYETLAKTNPRLIYATSHAFGKKGPDSDKQAYDPMAMARSGMLMAISSSDDEPGSMIPGAVADMMGGTFLGFAVIAGILARERFGIGQEIDSSLFGPMLWAQYLNISGYLSGNRTMPKVPRNNTWNPMSNSYRCKDGRWLFLISRDWHELCRLLHIESLENDPRFSEVNPRARNSRELIKILDETFAGKTRDEWIEYFKAEKAGLMYEVINNIPDLANDVQILANDLILEENHRGLGPIKMLKFPFSFSKTPVASARKAAPYLGEHTEEVLMELGYSSEQIAQLRNEKVI
jgi:crotonobetainyl-CoA:carnitine CoA-transferase CaiB-like acyl-CoA transferase